MEKEIKINEFESNTSNCILSCIMYVQQAVPVVETFRTVGSEPTAVKESSELLTGIIILVHQFIHIYVGYENITMPIEIINGRNSNEQNIKIIFK
jgi:hydrogenase-4 membrane subunit HyfE